MTDYDDPFEKARAKIRKMSTKKLLVDRERYNSDFKRYSKEELNRRGVQTPRQRALKQRVKNDIFGLGSVDRDVKKLIGGGF